MGKMHLLDGLQSLQMVKKAKRLTFSQHNLALFSKESYLPYCQAWQDRPLEDVLKLNPQGSPQETKSCLWWLWYRMYAVVSHTEGATTPCSQNLQVSGGVNVTQEDTPLHCSLSSSALSGGQTVTWITQNVTFFM